MGPDSRDYIQKLHPFRWICCAAWDRQPGIHCVSLELHVSKLREASDLDGLTSTVL